MSADNQKSFKLSGSWLSEVNITKLDGDKELYTTKAYKYMLVEDELDEEW